MIDSRGGPAPILLALDFSVLMLRLTMVTTMLSNLRCLDGRWTMSSSLLSLNSYTTLTVLPYRTALNRRLELTRMLTDAQTAVARALGLGRVTRSASAWRYQLPDHRAPRRGLIYNSSDAAATANALPWPVQRVHACTTINVVRTTRLQP